MHILRKNNIYAGCLYIYPIELFYAKKAEKYDIDFSFWITEEEFDAGNYEKVFTDLFNWLATEWPFEKERIFLRNILIPDSLK